MHEPGVEGYRENLGAQTPKASSSPLFFHKTIRESASIRKFLKILVRFLLRVPIGSSDTAQRLVVVQNSLVSKILVPQLRGNGQI